MLLVRRAIVYPILFFSYIRLSGCVVRRRRRPTRVRPPRARRPPPLRSARRGVSLLLFLTTFADTRTRGTPGRLALASRLTLNSALETALCALSSFSPSTGQTPRAPAPALRPCMSHAWPHDARPGARAPTRRRARGARRRAATRALSCMFLRPSPSLLIKGQL